MADCWCYTCQQFRPTSEFYRLKSGRHAGKLASHCKPCLGSIKRNHDANNPEQRKARDKRFMDKRYAQAKDFYERWLTDTKVEFKPMTEQEWLETCSYFGGCAICGSEHIEARHYFMKFGKGGRYAPWNMYPICEKCAVHTRLVENPFLWLDRFTGTAHKLGLNDERRERLLEWFQLQIERVKT